MSLRITLQDSETGERLSHMVSDYGAYATVCGLSDDDDQFHAVPDLCGVNPSRGIDCEHCASIFRMAKTYRAKDFGSLRGAA